jgi:cytochrome bd ubiquinol oxidase subunit I
MDPLLLARLQFGITTVYHFFFVPLTLGLSLFVALVQTLWFRTGNDIYRRMARFFGKLFLINFAIGVVTGIVQEFQFGMNWSEYSRFVGDIFGPPLAIEALLAFFLESTFLGLWIFGWERLGKRAHLASIWLVAIGANVSALWILIANSFMQHPVGYALEGGKAVLTSFSAVLFNPHIWHQLPHVLAAGVATGAFFVLGISAWHLLRKNEIPLFRKSFQIAATLGTISTLFVVFNGHTQAQNMAREQPMKLAATEALWQSENPASFSLFTIGDMERRADVFAIRLPRLLSLLAYNQLEGEVRGIRELQAEAEAKYGPGNYVPPAVIPYWSFRGMVAAGTLMLLLSVYALFISFGEIHDRRPFVLKLLLYSMALPYIANCTGWLLAEVGRYPWAVYGLVKLEQGVSPNVTAAMLATTLIGYVALYGALIVATAYLMKKYAKAGPEATEANGAEEQAAAAAVIAF